MLDFVTYSSIQMHWTEKRTQLAKIKTLTNLKLQEILIVKILNYFKKNIKKIHGICLKTLIFNIAPIVVFPLFL